MTGTEPLLKLLAQCVVRIDRDGQFSGTGFFVAPGEVLTCAHVVHGGKPITVHTADGVFYPAEPITDLLAPDNPQAAFYPQPDAAVLRLPGAPNDQACVRLEATDPAFGTDLLQLIAFTQGEHAPEAIGRSGATLHLEALFEQDGCPLYKLREGQVIGGFSGGPLLNLRTGGVCAVVESSRGTASDLGGFGVPLAAVARIDSGLLERNAQVQRSDSRWARAYEDQGRVAAERAGRRELLPLLAPVVELEWGPEVPPSELLRPRHAVVGFVPPGDLLDQVMRWRESDEPLRVLVLTAPGGFGKTRTAVEICRAAEAAGWTAGPIDADADGAEGLAELLTWPGRTVIAVDYAETRPELVTKLLKRLLRRRRPAPCRVVLVVRQGGGRQSLIDLFATGDARDELARLLRRAELVGLGHGERELDRRELFDAASAAFAPRLAGTPATGVDLYAEHFERPLFMLAAALLAVANPNLDVAALSAEQLLGEILDQHEARYWQRADDRWGLELHPDDRRTAVALAVLCGLSADQDDERVVRLVPSLGDAPAERVVQVVRWLRELYGPHGSLEPDLLAEVLVTRVITTSPALIGTALDAASDTQLTRALLVLSRVAGRSDTAGAAVRDALDKRLGKLVHRAVTGDAALVTALRLAISATRPILGAINAQHDIPIRSAATGLLAVEIGELAVDGLRRLSASDEETCRPLLAAALNTLSKTLSEIGQPTEGLPLIEEAVTIHRVLVQADPTRFLPNLAGSLNNQSNRLAGVGRAGEGLGLIQEAVTHYRELAQADPTRFLPDLAASLNNQARILDGLGWSTEAAYLFDVTLAENPEPTWARGVLLLARAQWLVTTERVAEVTDAAAQATELLSTAADRGRRGQARQLLRTLRTDHPIAVDQAWSARSGTLPVWLRLPEPDTAIQQLLIDWVGTASWPESFDFLADHAPSLLTDRAEASLEHLIDHNPGNTVLDQHLDILRAACEHGVDTVRTEFLDQLAVEHLAAHLTQWISTADWAASAEYLTAHAEDLLTDAAEKLLASKVAQQPGLLRYLGLLGLARQLGVEDAHALITDHGARDDARAAHPPAERLPLARLVAGLDDGSAEAQFAHALTSLEAEAEPEAVWAMTRCRDACASWERPSIARRLQEFADTHPELDLAPLHRALRAEAAS